MSSLRVWFLPKVPREYLWITCWVKQCNSVNVSTNKQKTFPCFTLFIKLAGRKTHQSAVEFVKTQSLLQSRQAHRDKQSQFSLQLFNFCHTLVTQDKDKETHLISLYQNSPEGPNSSMSQTWQLCSSFTSPPFLWLIVLFTLFPLPCFLQISLSSLPYLSLPLSHTPSFHPALFATSHPPSIKWSAGDKTCAALYKGPSSHNATYLFGLTHCI